MKKRFLEELKRLLAPLQENERQEILDFYEERFNTGLLYEGKTESQIVDELERPEDIARNVLKEYGLRFTPHGDQKTNTNKPVSPWRILIKRLTQTNQLVRGVFYGCCYLIFLSLYG